MKCFQKNNIGVYEPLEILSPFKIRKGKISPTNVHEFVFSKIRENDIDHYSNIHEDRERRGYSSNGDMAASYYHEPESPYLHAEYDVDYKREDSCEIHLFGDVSRMSVHWLSGEQINSFLKKFCRRNYPPYKAGHKKKKYMFICTKEIEPKTKIGRQWDSINPIGKPSFDGYHLCPGCALNLTKTDRFFTNCINLKTNMISYYFSNRPSLLEIKNMASSSNKYENMPQWLYDHDISVSRKNVVSKFPEYDVVVKKTKYRGLSGEILGFNPRYAYLMMAWVQCRKLLKEIDSSSYFERLRKIVSPALLYSIDNDEVMVRSVDKSRLFDHYELKRGQINSHFDMGRRTRIIEL